MKRHKRNIRFDFEGSVVLVTGGSKGIGKSIGEGFLEAGADVVVCARGRRELDAFAQSHRSPRLHTVQADLTKESEVRSMIDQIKGQFGRIDVLINNVGGAIKFGDFWKISNQDWKNAFDLNVMSMVHCSKEAISLLRASAAPRIINISSISGVEPGAYNPHYTHCKASVINLSKCLANFLAKERILVNCICPGTIETDAWEQSLSQIAEERAISLEAIREECTQAEVNKIPLGKMGTGEDVSSLALFLASDQADWITGSCFHVNGGKLKGIC